MALLDSYSQPVDRTQAIKSHLIIQGLDDAATTRAQKAQDLDIQAQQNERAKATAAREADTNQRAIDARTASNEFSQWATNPDTAGKGFHQIDPYSQQSIVAKYPSIAREIPGLFNEAQASASGNPFVGADLPPNTQVTSHQIAGLDPTQKLPPKPNRALDTMGAKLGVSFPPNATDEEKQTIIAESQGAAQATKSAPVNLNDDEQKIAQAIANYEQPPNQAMGRVTNPAVREKIMATAADLGYDAKEYPVKLASRRDFTSGQSARAITSLNTVMHHLGNALDAYSKMGNTGAGTWVNSPINAVRSRLGGNKDITGYETDANLVAEELPKLLKGGTPTKSEVDDWKAKLDSGLAPDQLQNNIKEIMAAIAGRVDGLHNQWQSAYLKPRDLPFLDEGARRVLSTHGFDPNAIDKAAESVRGLPGAPTGKAAPEMPTVTTKAERDALPSGAKYILDGKTYQKP